MAHALSLRSDDDNFLQRQRLIEKLILQRLDDQMRLKLAIEGVNSLTSAERHAIHSIAISGGEVENEKIVRLPDGTVIASRLRVTCNGYTSSIPAGLRDIFS